MGAWRALPARQVNARVPRRIPGGHIVPRWVVAYRGRIVRTLDGQPPAVEWCGHNHTKRQRANDCGLDMAASLNRQAARPSHRVWPAVDGLRTAQGFPLRHVPAPDAILGSVQPIRGWCQPCGQPIYRPEGSAVWLHTDTDATARVVGNLLALALGDGAEAYAASTAALEGGSR